METTILKSTPEFQYLRRMPEYEIQPGIAVSFFCQVDLTEAEKFRTEAEPKISYTALVTKAVAQALVEFPYANRRICRRIWLPFLMPRLQQFHGADIAVGIELTSENTASFAYADIIRQANSLSFSQINQFLEMLGSPKGRLTPQWISFNFLLQRIPVIFGIWLIRLPLMFPSLWLKYRGGATIVSSPAKYGIDTIAAVWSWPLGISFGFVKERPIVKNGQIVAVPCFDLTMNFDRRIMAGAQAARFFRRIVELLENPSQIR